jgi:RimJ/RimL family protein N-acetyltransferase
VSPPPARIETERLLLRRWELDDAVRFADLLDRGRDHYGAFISFFLEGDAGERMVAYRRAFDTGESWSYGAFLGERLVGGGGLFPRIGPGALEIGYHVAADCLRRGFATEIAAALVATGFDLCGAERLEMHIHPDNVASLGIPSKLSFVEERYDAERQVLIFSRVRSASEGSTASV